MTDTQVYFVFCKVYWIICVEKHEIVNDLLLFLLQLLIKKKSVFWEVAPTFYHQ